ncbi:GNAT acetyltransferase 2-domain-containing protein [Xylariomycetidae sp. FL0641]|nr:GNAT acetyltransferase 2-domain-containing protein [Xylariomycetidae sp. FL0641]
MPRKAVDSRIPALIRNGLQESKRSFFVVVGDRAKDVIVHLHYIMSTADLKQNKSVLWAYKNKLLGFTSHRKKRETKIKKEIKRGIREANSEDPFELFVSLHDIRYVYYKETEKILGNTYGMCILQDFEAITPNILARTIETVQGGGLCILLLKGMNSLKQLYSLSMDVHSRYRTEAYDDVVARFNERFLLSLGSCENCLVIDDELNVLPISGGKGVKPLPPPDRDEPKTESQKELESIKDSLQDTRPVGPLITLARTVDQAKALLTFVDAIAEKTLRNTVTLTAARGRGKSAALGVAIAAAVAHGYSNIFITSPSPENLKTLFQFIFKGFDALGYSDHTDYSIIQSTNPDFNKAIVRVNVHRAHRQTIQYIRPQDAHVLGQAELLVIDEAAAIPLPLVRKLMGPYLVFMASTINGYEGTGRSLSLKLVKQLREQSRAGPISNGTEVTDRASGKAAKVKDENYQGGRSLREITLSEPIRYAQGDPVEKWLNTLLCLDATVPRSKINTQGCPDPEACQLFKVNRDTLFSFHPVSEKFLNQMVAIYVSSHYKNTPDDLQLMSDAPSHELFVLTAPIAEAGRLPEPLCVIQVALEGKISRQSVLNSLSRGSRPAGDLIPWLVTQQFQDDEFASLSGARVVRIATNPDYVSMGYGKKALELLVSFYENKFANLSGDGELAAEETMVRVTDAELANASLQDEIKVRDINKMPPLFAKLSEIRPATLDYVGVSYGLTQPLHKFWKNAEFAPVYLRQTANDLTGEHTCVMLRPLETSDDRTWLGAYSHDFHNRFLSLLSYQFRTFASITALSIDESANAGARLDPSTTPTPLTKEALDSALSPFDMKRLDSYSNNMLDYHVILDLVPTLAGLYFKGRTKANVRLTGVQQAILLAVGLQRKDIDIVADELSLPTSQLLAMFIKIMKKMTTHFGSLVSGAIEAEMPDPDSIGVSVANASGVHDDEQVDTRFAPLETSLEDELEEGGDEALKELRRKQRELIDSLPLDQYEVEGDAPEWEDAEKQVRNASKRGQSNATVSVKSSKPKRKAGQTAAEVYEEAFGDGASRKKAKKSKKGQ